MIYIYGLLDPNTGEVRYVGKAINPRRRLMAHINNAAYEHTHKAAWIRQLLKMKLKPLLATLEVLDDNEDWHEAERWHIAQYPNLTNQLAGGLPSPMELPGVRDKVIAINIARCKGVPLSEEHKRKLADAKRNKPGNNTGKGGWKHRPQSIAQIRAKNKAAWTPAMREAARQRRLGVPPGNKKRS